MGAPDISSTTADMDAAIAAATSPDARSRTLENLRQRFPGNSEAWYETQADQAMYQARDLTRYEFQKAWNQGSGTSVDNGAGIPGGGQQHIAGGAVSAFRDPTLAGESVSIKPVVQRASVTAPLAGNYEDSSGRVFAVGAPVAGVNLFDPEVRRVLSENINGGLYGTAGDVLSGRTDLQFSPVGGFSSSRGEMPFQFAPIPASFGTPDTSTGDLFYEKRTPFDPFIVKAGVFLTEAGAQGLNATKEGSALLPHINTSLPAGLGVIVPNKETNDFAGEQVFGTIKGLGDSARHKPANVIAYPLAGELIAPYIGGATGMLAGSAAQSERVILGTTGLERAKLVERGVVASSVASVALQSPEERGASIPFFVGGARAFNEGFTAKAPSGVDVLGVEKLGVSTKVTSDGITGIGEGTARVRAFSYGRDLGVRDAPMLITLEGKSPSYFKANEYVLDVNAMSRVEVGGRTFSTEKSYGGALRLNSKSATMGLVDRESGDVLLSESFLVKRLPLDIVAEGRAPVQIGELQSVRSRSALFGKNAQGVLEVKELSLGKGLGEPENYQLTSVSRSPIVEFQVGAFELNKPTPLVYKRGGEEFTFAVKRGEKLYNVQSKTLGANEARGFMEPDNAQNTVWVRKGTSMGTYLHEAGHEFVKRNGGDEFLRAFINVGEKEKGAYLTEIDKLQELGLLDTNRRYESRGMGIPWRSQDELFADLYEQRNLAIIGSKMTKNDYIGKLREVAPKLMERLEKLDVKYPVEVMQQGGITGSSSVSSSENYGVSFSRGSRGVNRKFADRAFKLLEQSGAYDAPVVEPRDIPEVFKSRRGSYTAGSQELIREEDSVFHPGRGGGENPALVDLSALPFGASYKGRGPVAGFVLPQSRSVRLASQPLFERRASLARFPSIITGQDFGQPLPEDVVAPQVVKPSPKQEYAPSQSWPGETPTIPAFVPSMTPPDFPIGGGGYKLGFGGGGSGGFSFNPSHDIIFRNKYSPSVAGALFEVHASRRAANVATVTGIGVRPIITK